MKKFKSPKSLETPVLFLIFNRFNTTKLVFEAIKKAKPPRLYIASDGPRSDKEEKDIIKKVREYVLNNIDWNCEVKTLFREKNLGCKMAVSSAITWFFDNEEQGIILEDDCLPSQSFFWYCEELLNKYRDDMRIWHISGNNFHFGWRRDKDYSYYFGGIYGSIWGWASWATRWKKYDVDMKNYDELKTKKYLENCYDGSKAVKSRIMEFEKIKEGFDTWDFQWVYCRWINNGLTIIPNKNLVENLGFSKEATHTKNIYDKRANMQKEEIEFPLKHPDFVMRDAISEKKFYNDFVKSSFKRKFQNFLLRLSKWVKK